MGKRRTTSASKKFNLQIFCVTFFKCLYLSPLFLLIKIGQVPGNIFSKLSQVKLRLPKKKKAVRKVKAKKVKPVKKIAARKDIWAFLLSAVLMRLKNIPIRKLTIYRISLKRTEKKTWALSFYKKRGRPRLKPLSEVLWHRFRVSFIHTFPRTIRLQILLGVLAFILLGYSLGIAKLALTLPTPSLLTPTGRPLTTQIMDREGKMLYQFYEGRNRKLVKLDELPPHLINATIATEDKNFYRHIGVDPAGIARALRLNLSGSKTTLQGGSTITQQLIKNTLLTSDQTLGRKIKEAILALWTERIYSKADILQMYFNEAPYGGPVWGIETAAEMYFGKEAKDLDLAESAFLAGLPAAPTEYSPYGIHPEKGVERQKAVLSRMVAEGYLTQEEAEEAGNRELSFKAPVQDIKAAHFVMYIRSVLARKYGDKIVSQGGLKVITTLDLDLQEMAEKQVTEEVAKLKPLKVGNGAAMVTEAKTGQILSMVGSKNYFDKDGGNFNVTLALRQPGSSIKPITYATAFKIGYTPGTILLDTPTSFPNPWGKPYTPVNYDGRFHGPVTIRTALGSSYNIPAVKTLQLVGIPEMLNTARDMGITTLTDTESYGLSLTLGGGAVKMVDMMAAYGTLASGGLMYEPNPILEVIDPNGNVLENNRKPEGKKALTEEIAYLLSHVLSDNNARAPAFGTNSQLVIPGHTVAVKTGTSDDKRDNWVFGYTPEFVVGVWVGNMNNSPMDQRLASGITGATPIWHGIMSNLLVDKPNIAFKRPTGIIEATVDGKRDLAISGQKSKTVVGYKRVKQKDEVSGEERDVTIFSDQFSSFTATQAAQVLPTQTTQ